MSMFGDDLNWFYSLDPEDQQAILSQAENQTYGYGQGNASTMPLYGFEDFMLPEFSPVEAGMQTFGGGLPPELNKYGEMMPWGLDQEAQATSLARNRNSLIADQITGAFAGPGGYDLGAFTPTYQYSGQPLQRPGNQMATYYAGLGGGGYQSLIAEALMSGKDPATAVSDIIRLASLPDTADATPAERRARDTLIASLPIAPPRGGGNQSVTDRLLAERFGISPEEGGTLTPEQQLAEKYNLSDIYSFANDLGQKMATDPTSGFVDPTTGLMYATPPEEVWGPTARKYQTLGIPFPTERYTDEKYIEAMAPRDLAFEQRQAGDIQAMDALEQIARLSAAAAKKDLTTAQGAWDKFQGQLADANPEARRARQQEFLRKYSMSPEGRLQGPAQGPPTVSAAERVLGPGLGRGIEARVYPTTPPNPALAHVPMNAIEQMFREVVQPKAPLIQGTEDYGNLKIVEDERPAGVPRARWGPMGDRSKPSERPRRMTERDVQAARKRDRGARDQLVTARNEEWKARNALPSNWKDRLLAAHTARQADAQGRTPTQDALLRRMMVSANQGLYRRYPA